jgi:glucose/arabinose dehydrogenase
MRLSRTTQARTTLATALTTLLALPVAAGALTGALSPAAASPGTPARPAVVPPLTVTTIASGLDIPWDVKSIGGGRLLITERTSKRLLLWQSGQVRPIAFPSSTVWASGETGLMGLAVDPGFSSNRRFYTCQGGFRGAGVHDVRVNAWTLNASLTTARLSRTLIHGLPATSGRHGGCRLLITDYGALMVGTGDAATGTNPRNLSSLGGKTLRLNRLTGAPWPSNPFIRSRSLNARYVTSFGHRNVQGLTQRSDGSIWSVEQGTFRDDEVNRISAGGDYGYHPVPGYNEQVPMTDQRLPGTQINARWRSGDPTIATSGAAWVLGRQWGANNGTLAVAALKAERVLFMRFSSAGTLQYVRTPAALRQFGRLRSVTRLGNGDLLITTSNGGGTDRVLRVRPQG